jgi:dTDP-4-amino-4,6-dideoxygalactose transaminase
LAAFSFFVTKTVPAGEGGCIVHSNDVLQDPVQLMPNQGKASHETIHRYLGGSLRITEFSAAMAHMRMGTIDAFNAKRRFFMAHFSKASSDVLQPVAMGHETSEPGGYKCIWMVKKGLRTAVCDLAKDMGVTLARPVYEVPLHRQPILFPHADPGEFPQAEAFTSADGHICLPMWHAMEPEHIERVDAFLHECQKLAL